MDSIQAYLEAPPRTTGYISCLICRRVQGWTISPLKGYLRASEFVPALDYPSLPPTSGDPIECAWCHGPAAPTPIVIDRDFQDRIGWKVKVEV